MGLNIVGWVEIKDDSRNKWWGIIKLKNLIQTHDYRAFGYFFGVSHNAVPDPVAANRGLPSDASREARYELDLEGYTNHSWAEWKEINESGWQNKNFAEEWWILLEMMRLLADTYGDDQVRLVVAFV